jgi:hypothetical protein
MTAGGTVGAPTCVICNLFEGLTAYLENEFEAQKFPLNFLENGRMSTILFSATPERNVYAKDCNMIFYYIIFMMD